MSLEISQIPKAAARELLAGIAPVADSGEVSWSEFFSAPSEQRAELHQGEQHWSASALLGGERGARRGGVGRRHAFSVGAGALGPPTPSPSCGRRWAFFPGSSPEPAPR